MAKLHKPRRLADAYTFPGFRPLPRVQGMFGDPKARLITLVRRGKKRFAARAVRCITLGTIAGVAECGICRAPTIAFTSISRCAAWTVGAAAR